MNAPEWNITSADEAKLGAFRPLIGKWVLLSKIGTRNEQGGFDIFDPQRGHSGDLSIVDRGGGPSVFLSGRGFSDWFITSWILRSSTSSEGVEFETENSLYLATTKHG